MKPGCQAGGALLIFSNSKQVVAGALLPTNNVLDRPKQRITATNSQLMNLPIISFQLKQTNLKHWIYSHQSGKILLMPRAVLYQDKELLVEVIPFFT
jgi:hypothetical protein